MEAFVGTILPVGFNYAPYGWALCNGAIMSIAQNQALFALLGTTYGGNGTSTFGLPNLQGRVPIGVGNGPGLTPRTWGEFSGAEQVTLLNSNMPTHNHTLSGSATITGGFQASHKAGTQSDPTGNYMANAANPAGGVFNTYIDPTAAGSLATMAGSLTVGGSTGLAGSNLPVQTMPPFLAVYYIIALQGIYPSRS